MLSKEILAAALVGLEMRKAKLEEQINLVRGMMSGKAKKLGPVPIGASEVKAKGTKKKRKLSPEARERIAEAQRKRWAASRGEEGTTDIAKTA